MGRGFGFGLLTVLAVSAEPRLVAVRVLRLAVADTVEDRIMPLEL